RKRDRNLPVFPSAEPLFLGSRHDLAIEDERCRDVMENAVDSKDRGHDFTTHCNQPSAGSGRLLPGRSHVKQRFDRAFAATRSTLKNVRGRPMSTLSTRHRTIYPAPMPAYVGSRPRFDRCVWCSMRIALQTPTTRDVIGH